MSTNYPVMAGPMTCPTCHAALPECDDLRTEVERLNKLLETERRVARMIGDVHKKDAAEVERLTLADRQWADHVKRVADERDKLRAENQRLNLAVDMLAEERATWEADNERLRAQVEELTQILDSHRVWVSDDQLPVWVCQAEVERLRAELADLLPRMDADALRIENLWRENERLRAALEQILSDPDARILDSHRDDGWDALAQHME